VFDGKAIYNTSCYA